ncbi:acetylglutamate kinase [Gehongia tenuis]|uniref:Acetylglutamate kinase n=1 Tax=Gehongia tenuis TaxID=2763655 RepID=A0A926D396_9FIRM|nr:acetylglutamate kinase [Gehongia tenuis]MBC8530707.1 acetylglutamate kinase [Gehongia tenuis]
MDKTETLVAKANILIEALPYIQKLYGKTVVIKYGGNAMKNEILTRTILQDITMLKYCGVNPIVVHGGGPDISAMLKKLNIETQFVGGLRVTDAATMEVVQMVLCGKINKDIVAHMGALGGKAIGLCGKDAGLIRAHKKCAPDGTDLGFVGEIDSINIQLLTTLSLDEYIPVIAPIGVGENGETYNINADTVAGEIAAAAHAEKLIFLTDVDGIRRDPGDPATLISHLTVDEIYQLIRSGVVDGGMIPKVEGCIRALEEGVARTHILNGTIPHPILLEIFTDQGIGTMVTDDV